MLAKAGELPRTDDGWAYEFKWDGVRAIVTVDEDGVRARSRTGKDLAGAFPELNDLAPYLKGHQVVLDGEIVAIDGGGRSDFGRLQQRLTSKSIARTDPIVHEVPATFLAFDLLELDGHELLQLPYDDRRKLLEKLELSGDTFATPPTVVNEEGSSVLAISREHGMEGVVAKRRDSVYSPGKRTGAWIKVKNFHTQEAIIGGWTKGNGALAGSLGALLLGIPGENGLSYIGKVGTGFTDAMRRELVAALSKRGTTSSPFTGRLERDAATGAQFVRPELVGEVRYGEWTRDGHLRHPSWRGLRPDKNPEDVTREP
jgi:bifunctional non-homologous end joining protein LigD